MQALDRLYMGIRKYTPLLYAALEEDLGKSAAESYVSEIGFVLSEITHTKQNLAKWMKPNRVKPSLTQFGSKCYEIHEPLGVTLIMAPWNYPILLNLSPLIGAISSGNCCILKPSNRAPATSSAIAKLIGEVFPPKYITVVEGGRDENTQLLDQRFDYIFFTGGTTVGRIVLEKAAVHLTPVTLELGGKSPCIIDETADIKKAAKRVAFGKTLNTGQTCVAPDYILVHWSVKEEFVKELSRQITKMVGKNATVNKNYPKIISDFHFNRLMGLMEGENILYGGIGNKETQKIHPTLLGDITGESPVMQEEIFGPILPIITYNKLDWAKAFILEREKPLALYLFTTNPVVEREVLRDISFGGGCVNDTVIHMVTSNMAFGGVGNSGMGRYHGFDSFDTFSHRKSVLKQSSWFDLPMKYPPYTKGKLAIIKKILK